VPTDYLFEQFLLSCLARMLVDPSVANPAKREPGALIAIIASGSAASVVDVRGPGTVAPLADRVRSKEAAALGGVDPAPVCALDRDRPQAGAAP